MSNRFGNEDCSGKGEVDVAPDVMGSLFGLRSFKVDPDTGHLTGVYFNARWTEGTMQARCFQTISAKVVPPQAMYPLTWLGMGKMLKNTYLGYKFDDGVATLQKGHYPAKCPGLARGDHGCGFYAMHGASMPPLHYTMGVIEMFGQVELGPKGVRSSQARLVALVAPTDAKWSMTQRNMTINDGLAVAAETRLSNLLDEVPPNESRERTLVQDIERTTRNLLGANRRALAAREQLLLWDDKTRWLYPNVPVYDDLDEMLEAHPVPPLDHLFKED